ncbi:DoxX family protein [Hymenobacter wooponensis]|uniref:DoxX family protein n=1 Tax=Hymenobacter wooponensis TaxID=1525360 RepID=A0A4Z0MM71_9BACT|nr:DoxX family protein [Hymenobacter wooponensis]TGD80714.1 DoxX family protein [Hymenobacter wooponensis]
MNNQPKKSKLLRVALWITQSVLALLYIGTGLFKLGTPIATVAGMWPWAGEYPTLLRGTGMLDLVGGIGIVLPALTHIRPYLTVAAAAGLALLQLGAIAFHLSRGEASNTPFNFIMLALALLVFWGRRTKAPLPSCG